MDEGGKEGKGRTDGKAVKGQVWDRGYMYLKHYAKQDAPVGEAFWIPERDGALMVADPHISQELSFAHRLH